MVPEMFTEAGVEERKTNHSLRAAGVSQLFEAGVDEKVIQSRSGHRRIESLRTYERVTPAQEQAVSNILSSSSRMNYQSEVERMQQAASTTMSIQQQKQEWSSSIAQSGIQCFGCTVNVYQGSVDK